MSATGVAVSLPTGGAKGLAVSSVTANGLSVSLLAGGAIALLVSGPTSCRPPKTFISRRLRFSSEF